MDQSTSNVIGTLVLLMLISIKHILMIMLENYMKVLLLFYEIHIIKGVIATSCTEISYKVKYLEKSLF